MKNMYKSIHPVLLLVLLLSNIGCGGDLNEGLPIDGDLVVNGNFESGVDGWLFFPNGGTSELDNTAINGGDGSSAKVVTNGGSNPGIKQERIGIGMVQAGDEVQIQFDHIGSTDGEGGFFNLLLFVELAEGEEGTPITHIFDPKPRLTNSWSTFVGTYTIPNNAPVTGGISFLIESVCGGAAGCSVSANVDNVIITLNSN